MCRRLAQVQLDGVSAQSGVDEAFACLFYFALILSFPSFNDMPHSMLLQFGAVGTGQEQKPLKPHHVCVGLLSQDASLG